MRRWNVRWSPVLARMERAGISVDRAVLARLSGEFAQAGGRLEKEIYELAGEQLQYRLAQAARRHFVRPDGLAGRAQDQDRRLVTDGDAAGGSGGQGIELAAQSARLAPADQAQVDLYRRAARLHQSRHRARAHLLCDGLDLDRAAVLDRAQSAEHPGPHRGGPQHPHRLHRAQGHKLVCADYSQIELRVLAHVADIPQLRRPLPTASTFMP